MAKKRFRALKYIILFVVALVLFFVVMMVMLNRSTKAYEAPVSPVRVAKAGKGRIVQSMKFNGYVEAQAMIPVVPFVAGTILEYYPVQGQYVHKDEVLAVIDKKPYELQYQQALAAYEAANTIFERTQNLVEIKAASQQTLDEIRAQRDAYKAQMELAQVQIDYATVKAPVEGTILTTNSAKGSIAAQGNLLCAIADLNNLVVRLALPEKYYTLINDNLEDLKATVEHGTDSVQTEVLSVSPYVNPQSKTFVLELKLLGDIKNFKPGMFVTVNIDYQVVDDVYVMPNYVRNTDGTMYLYDEKTQEAQVISFETEVADSEFFKVSDEYVDSTFIVDGQGTVFDGQKVRVIQ